MRIASPFNINFAIKSLIQIYPDGKKNDSNRFDFQVVTDLVQGEFMQLGSKETENERFSHYLTKNYRKTASLIANSVKAVSCNSTIS